jgi:predicted NBD/HSP70 family sugar kinase
MSMDVVVALDIGGTKVLAAAAGREGAPLRTLRRPTPASLEEGLQLLASMARECAAGARIRAVGASIGGPLDWKEGVVSPLHQPSWRAVPLKALLEKEFGCPFGVDVDTNVAALGEWEARGRLPRRLLYLTISTGMGGGFVVDGHLYRGANGEHPEVAHQWIGSDARCECGAVGCLEERVSGNGIRRRFGKPAEQLADAEWSEVGLDLGRGLRTMTTLLAPDLIAIGGGVAIGAGERLLGPAREVAAASLKLLALPPVELSALGYDTALQGALALARELA